jgi:8-oxo-dGTP pyrophosphatase MutT (NUDIX family)
MVEERSAGAVVYRDEEEGPRQYLLLKYRSGHWGFIKGHVEDGETDRETIRRESEEEAGLTDLRFLDGFEEHTEYTFQRGNETVNKRVDFKLARTSSTEIELGSPNEHNDYAWVDRQGALERLTFEDMRRVFREAHDFLDQVAQSNPDTFAE